MTPKPFDPDALLDRAKQGESLTGAELEDVASALRAPDSPYDEYTLLHILGRASAYAYRPVLEQALGRTDDPMIPRIALQALGNWWGLAGDYRSQ
jgi:hypothetical protein